MLKLKISIVGPNRSGKTLLSNFFADAGDNMGKEYVPTIGCRILEMEQTLKISNRNEKTEIELWDCSGDLKYENCWSALSDEANGVIFVYNPKDPSHAKELNQWFTHFVQQTGIREECCMVVVNKFDSDATNTARGESKLSNLFENIRTISSNFEEDSEAFRNEFKRFIQKVADFSKSKQDQEEKMILR